MPRSAFNQIKWKLTTLIMGISAVVVALGGFAVVAYDFISSEYYFVSRVDTMAEITAANSAVAVSLRNEADAREVLEPLQQRPDFDFVGLFFSSGAPFVVAKSEGTPDEAIRLMTLEANTHQLTGDHLVLQRRIFWDNTHVGFIVIGANMSEELARSRAFLFIACAAMAGLVGVALLLGTRLQRLVSEPIAQLANAANDISERKDYSIRVQKNSNDEVGSLVDAFNEMLTEIERQNRSLIESETRLKLALTASKMGIWEWDLQTGQIRCSEETRLIFGCPKNEATMAMFSQLLHPEDSDRVLKALRNAVDTAGVFACEYRINKPGNQLAWVMHLGRIQPGSKGLSTVLAGIVQDITFRKQVESERQKLVANLLHAEEEERRRIARELHDTTAQHLAALKMNCVRLFESVPDQPLAMQSRQLIDQALQELRTLTYVLHPPVLEEFGLAGALTDFAAGISRRNGIKVCVDVDGYLDRAPATTELALFRVIQESVTNAIRHSGTDKVAIELSRDENETRLSVRDFGQGISNDSGPLGHAGVGIGSMKERMALVGGELAVESTGQGVTVTAIVPHQIAETPETIISA